MLLTISETGQQGNYLLLFFTPCHIFIVFLEEVDILKNLLIDLLIVAAIELQKGKINKLNLTHTKKKHYTQKK